MRRAAIPSPYWLYLLECEGGVYYTGIALDVERRFYQHLFGLGAKFTRARPPLRVLAAREYPNKSEALRAELRLKALRKDAKVGFFSPPQRPRSRLRAEANPACPDRPPAATGATSSRGRASASSSAKEAAPRSSRTRTTPSSW